MAGVSTKKPSIDDSYFLQYRQAIKSGEIIAGREIKQVLEMCYKDLSSDKYYYDMHISHMFITFIERFLKLTKSPFYGQPVKLMLFQKAYIELLFSFKRTENNRDRFTHSTMLIARKNGKTTLTAFIALCILLIAEGGQDILCASNDDKQASLVFGEIDRTRKLFDPDEEYIHANLQYIENKLNFSRIFKMSDKQQNIEGRNIDFAILDESNMLKDDALASAIDQSMSVKVNPKFINITTEGFIIDGYLDKELDFCRSILSGEETADYCLPFLFTQDSEIEVWQDPSSWIKSNPTLGEIKTWNFLERRIERSKSDKSVRMWTLNKDYNVKQNNAQAWLALEDYDYPQEVKTLEDFRGCVALGAVDLSETTDLTCAKIMLMRKDDPKKYIFTKYFIPENKISSSDSKMNDINAGAKYLEWAKAGYVHVEPGTDIDLTRVSDWFNNLYRDYGIKTMAVGYDQRFADDFIKRVKAETVLIMQNKKTLSNPMKLVEVELKNKLINYGGNPVDKWCLGNCSMEMDNFGDIMAVKIGGSQALRIDGAVTLIILYAIYRRKRADFTRLLK